MLATKLHLLVLKKGDRQDIIYQGGVKDKIKSGSYAITILFDLHPPHRKVIGWNFVATMKYSHQIIV